MCVCVFPVTRVDFGADDDMGDDDDDEDTLRTVSALNSTSESLQHINSIPIAPYERFSHNSQSESSFYTAFGSSDCLNELNKMDTCNGDSDDDTLVDGDISISDNFDGYQSARDEFIFHIDHENPLIDLSGTFDDSNAARYGRKYGR